MNLNTLPKVSVLMSVHNSERYLHEAIESILGQTFEDFEFIIIDDGSTDKSLEILSGYDDKRIVLIKNQENLGLTKSLNKGIGYAKGEYIARMDADDISLHERLEKQIKFMENHPEVDISGTWYETFGSQEYIQKLPTRHNDIKAGLLFYTTMAHPTIMLKKSVFDKFKYPENFSKAQDYALWTTLIDHYTFANIPEALVKYRIHNRQISVHAGTAQADYAKKALRIFLQHLKLSDQVDIHYKIFLKQATSIHNVKIYLENLKHQNLREGYFDIDALSQVLFDQLWVMINLQKKYSFHLLTIFYTSSLYLAKRLTLKMHLKFIIKCIFHYSKKC